MLDTDTQMDFVNEKEVYIAPALTWKPQAGTSLTLLGQYRKDDTVPSPATYLPTPNHPVRPNLFVGEPDHDKFERNQWAAGYLFEHRLDSIWQVRQNLRYTSIDVDYKTVYGVGSSDDVLRSIALPSGLTRRQICSRSTIKPRPNSSPAMSSTRCSPASTTSATSTISALAEATRPHSI